MDYFIAMTRPGNEDACHKQLIFERENITVYYPTIAIIKKLRHVKLPRLVLTPAFPGYLFVACQTGDFYSVVQHTPACQGLLYIGKEPARIREIVVEELKEREREWHKSPMKMKSGLVPGQIVRIKEGVLTGFSATILDVGKNNARVSVNAPGRCGQRVTIKITELGELVVKECS